MQGLLIPAIVKFIAAGVVILSEAKNLATLGRKARFFVGAKAPPQNDTNEDYFSLDQ
jgi:hypothetical protein